MKQGRNLLKVLIGHHQVGSYCRESSGATSFRYTSEWLDSEHAFPISLSIPLSDRNWTGTKISHFFDGLLPDNPDVRNQIAAREQAESSSSFDLLAVIGRDCVGALRLVLEGEDSDPNEAGKPSQMSYLPLAEAEISSRLDALKSNPLGIRPDEAFRISIAGMQEKTAFLQLEQDVNEWQLPLGLTPTSHIFKPAMRNEHLEIDFFDSPWNEWFCLEICHALGLETARSKVLFFAEKPVIVVKRFDRIWQEGTLYRIPQEDFCQALGHPPTRKYQSDGGPGILDILKLLNGAIDPHKDRITILKAQIVFWLLSAIDGHAKNFSIFHTSSGFRLAPLYDVMSSAPYPQFSPHKIKMAMAVGNKSYYRMRQIQPRHFFQTGRKAGIHTQDIRQIFSDISLQIPDTVEHVRMLATTANMPKATSRVILQSFLQKTRLLENLQDER